MRRGAAARHERRLTHGVEVTRARVDSAPRPPFRIYMIGAGGGRNGLRGRFPDSIMADSRDREILDHTDGPRRFLALAGIAVLSVAVLYVAGTGAGALAEIGRAHV